MDVEIFGVDLSMKELFGGKVEAISVSFTGSVFDFSFTGVAATAAGDSQTLSADLLSFIGVDDVKFFDLVRL